MKWFVMLNTHQGIPTPLIQGEEDLGDEVALYGTEKEAEAAAEDNMLGAACGYEVYEWPWGED
jgi:hypothetical protein